MNTYELTMITADKEAMEKIVKLVKEAVKKAKGEINKEDLWGEKTLMYPIKKNKTGQYMHLVLSMPAAAQPKLDGQLRLEESLLRYLFVRV